MTRFLLSLVLGLILGVGLGLFLGWGVFPTATYGNPASSLAPEYQEEYTAYIAAGFRSEGDTAAAIERLTILGVPDVRQHVRHVTEVFIHDSRRLEDIYNLVALADALEVITPQMEPYRQIINP